MYRHASTCLVGPMKRLYGLGKENPAENSLDVESPSARENPSNRKIRGIRQKLVSRVRAEIAAGTYDTPEKFEIALERMLNQLERE